MPTFHTVNFGCRASQADGAALEAELCQRGFGVAADPRQADIVVLNSCTVTAAADYDLRQTARRIHRENPVTRILVTGCYAQRRPEELAALAGVQWVVGNSHKAEIGKLLSEEYATANGHNQFLSLETLFAPTAPPSLDNDFQSLGATAPAVAPLTPNSSPKILVGNIFDQKQFSTAPVFGGAAVDRTRPNLKIQDGCNNRCSFCIIPYVRGQSRSLPLPDVLKHIRALCAAGYREVVLSGVNLGRYGRDLPAKVQFPQLLRTILEETPVERLRLSSVEPMDFADRLLDLMASTARIARHVHAPLQSGSDHILRRMHRKYHPQNYRERILAAYERMPDAAFGADVIVGFPGESEEDFEQTRRLIESLPFTYLHVFPFSRRPGTPADRMEGQVNGAVIRKRSQILREMAAEKNLRFRERQAGRVLSVLTLEEALAGGTSALSDNYLKVFLPGVRLPGNQLIPVRILAVGEQSLVGRKEPSAVHTR